MIALFQERLAGAQRLMDEAAFSPVPEIPAALSRAVGLLDTACAGLKDVSVVERELVSRQLQSFRARLAIFSSAMQRGEAIFRGYSRQAGVSLHEYGPSGVSCDVRDPAFLNLTA